MKDFLTFTRPSMGRVKVNKASGGLLYVCLPEPRGCVPSGDKFYANEGDHEGFPIDTTAKAAEELVECRIRALSNALALVIEVRRRDAQVAAEQRARAAYDKWRASLNDPGSFDQLPPEVQAAWHAATE